MKKDQKQKIREMSISQLQKRIEQINKEILDNKMKLSLGNLKNVHANKSLKKERAFILFTLSQKTEEKTSKISDKKSK